MELLNIQDIKQLISDQSQEPQLIELRARMSELLILFEGEHGLTPPMLRDKLREKMNTHAKSYISILKPIEKLSHSISKESSGFKAPLGIRLAERTMILTPGTDKFKILKKIWGLVTADKTKSLIGIRTSDQTIVQLAEYLQPGSVLEFQIKDSAIRIDNPLKAVPPFMWTLYGLPFKPSDNLGFNEFEFCMSGGRWLSMAQTYNLMEALSQEERP